MACLNRSTSIKTQGQVGRELRADHDSPRCRVGLVEVAEFVDDCIQVGWLQLQVLNAGEPEKILDDPIQPLNLMLEPLDSLEHAAVARGFGVLKVLGQEVEVQGERREWVADLMSQAAGQFRNLGILGAKSLGDFRLFVRRRRWLDRLSSPARVGERHPSRRGDGAASRIAISLAHGSECGSI